MAIRRNLTAALAEADEADKADAIEIVAVSKKHIAATIEKALAAGHRVFGENRVQEALGKWPDLRARYPGVVLHLIGPLQSNKASDAVAFFDVIETIDRPKIAKAIAAEIARQGRRPRLLVQVNTGEETQKAGVSPADADAFIRACKDDHGLVIEGVMCIPPAEEPPAPHFALLKKIADRNNLQTISMGMSHDYEIAAQLGATHVRVGSGVFGPRPV